MLLGFINTDNSYTPPSNGLQVWLNAQTGITLVGGNVDIWADQSGNGNNFSAPTSGQRPTYQSTGINNQPSLLFSGTQGLWTSSKFSFTDFTALVVFNDNSGLDNFERLLDHNVNTGFWIGRNGTTNQLGGGVQETTGAFGIYTNYVENTNKLIRSERNGTTHTIKVGSSTVSNTVLNTPTILGVMAVGMRNDNNGTRYANNMQIAEVLVYNRSLTHDNTLTQAETYLINKYGL